MSVVWISLFVLFIVILTEEEYSKAEQNRFILKHVIRKKKGTSMSDIIKQFIGKECIISTMRQNIVGTVESADGSWIKIVTKGNADFPDVINLEYISRIREYPKKRSGKRKTVFS